MLNDRDFYIRKHDEPKTVYVGSGFSLSTVLTLIFLVLKLTNVIAWSWWWVFSPLWISVGLVVLILLIFLIVVCIGTLIAIADEKK